jgi:hypothetical protein
MGIPGTSIKRYEVLCRDNNVFCCLCGIIDYLCIFVRRRIMAESILGLLHNMKTYSHYKGEQFRLEEKEKDLLVAFLEQEDVQKCIPKVPKFVEETEDMVEHYECPACHKMIMQLGFDCTCGQKLKWMEVSNETKNNNGSSIFDNFGVGVSSK